MKFSRVNSTLGSVVSEDNEGRFKLTPEDISRLSEDLGNSLIPFEQVKITGDLGEGTCIFMTQSL